MRDDPFPIDAARDLVGLVRAIYAVRALGGAGAAELGRIQAMGELLDDAIQVGRVATRGTRIHAAAWRKAERACELVCALVAMTDGAEPLILASIARTRMG